MSEPAQLYLLIGGKYYHVERIVFDGERQRLKGWKLTPFEDKQNHGPYQVIRDGNSLTCQCADFTMQKARQGQRCKHISALVGIFGESL